MYTCTKLTLSTAGFVALLMLAAPVKASTIVFCGPDVESGPCEGKAEQKVFLDPAKAVLTSKGDVGSPGSSETLVVKSLGGMLNTFYDSAGGFGTITPANLPPPAGKQIDFNGLSFTIPGFTFSDIAFDVQLTPSSSPTDTFTASAFGPGMTLLDSHLFSDAPDTDKQFSVTDTAGGMTQVNIASLTGFDEVKHIEVSGVTAIPEASTWAMFVSGFGLMGLGAWLRKRAHSVVGAL